jgi:hypothetical protein
MAKSMPSCYGFRVGRSRCSAALGSLLVACACVAVPLACSRSGLDDLSPPAENADGALPAAPPFDASADGAPTASPTGTPRPPACVPHDETCNGRDDDCDGQVDEDLPPIPCPGGGERYCVAGRLSACPTRCETCVPGSERVCFLSYCTFWATETCAADGRSFGTCREHRAPAECDGVASQFEDAWKSEKCCLDNGYCCVDEFDLDGDGNTSEMLGACDEVACAP